MLLQSVYSLEIGEAVRVSRCPVVCLTGAEREPGARGVRKERTFPPDQRHMPADVCVLYPVYPHAWMLALFGDHSWQEANAHSGGHKLDDEIDLA